MTVMEKVTSTAMVVVTGNSKGGYHCNSGSDGKGDVKATASAAAKAMVETMDDSGSNRRWQEQRRW